MLLILELLGSQENDVSSRAEKRKEFLQLGIWKLFMQSEQGFYLFLSFFLFKF